MTDHHLNDELLSAHLDGSGDGDVATHLAQCPQCATRLASLRAARDLVRTPPVPVSAQKRAAAVATVLSRARLEATAGATVHDIAGPPAVVTELAWYRRPGVLAGAAAAAVVMAVAIPVALGANSTASKSSSALKQVVAPRLPSKRPSDRAAAHAPRSAQPGTVTPGVPAVSAAPAVPDFGSVPSTAKLQSDVAELGSAGSAGSGSSGSSAFSNSAEAPGASRPAVAPSCVQDTRTAANGGAYGPAVVATATYQGTPAVVMEFWPTPNAPATNAASSDRGVIAVVSRAACTLLATTPT